jgi:uracil-DNA glycosylase family 4
MSYSGLNRPGIGRFAGQLKEYLEFQKILGRRFIVRPGSSLPFREEKEEGAAGCYESLPALNEAFPRCRNCALSRTRHRVVAGQGALKARLMLVGEAPGVDEDRQGQPFVGPSGQLLTRMIQAIDLKREKVFITLAVKCHPPENRLPLKEETEACRPFLLEEIRLVDPEILVALGDLALRTITGSKEGVSALRGRWLDFQGRHFMATHHPDFLLKNPGAKREAWEDLKKVRREYDGLDS